MKEAYQIAQTVYQPGSGFIGAYQRKIKDVVIPYQYRVLKDEEEGAEKSHVVQNFINAGKALRKEEVSDGFYGMVFQDSDAGKWLEAAAYALTLFPDETLEQEADELIDLISKAQDEDGYLNTYFTIKDKEKRFTNLMEAHELYCSGHLMEAACAYYEATGKDKLLQVMLKNALHIYDLFVLQGKEGYPGHPEIELALMRLYRSTGEKKCMELAEHFINKRGVDPEYFAREGKKRDWCVWGYDSFDKHYAQFEKPVREQEDAVGHAVRAVYLYTGMADLAAEKDDESLKVATRRLWQSITKKRMYVTGGIGSTNLGEAFTEDYDLPSDTAYAETCASIGLMFFASRMLEMEIDREYADVMERAFYNTVLAGMALDGKRFFYVNPLEVVPGITEEAATKKHVLIERPKLYGCACCPPNVARLISSFGKYAYSENSETAYCHLFADGIISFENGLELKCETKYPYDFTIYYEVLEGHKNLGIRIPSWSTQYKVQLNGKTVDNMLKKGYIYLEVNRGDQIVVSLDEKPYYLYPSSKIPALTGKVAVARGPLVYAFEGVDNSGDVLSLAIRDDAPINVVDYEAALLCGTVKLEVEATRSMPVESLYTMKRPDEMKCIAYAVPYYTWGNRGKNQMRVWMDRR